MTAAVAAAAAAAAAMAGGGMSPAMIQNLMMMQVRVQGEGWE